MGLRNRQRAYPVTVEVINRHNHHSRLTYEDWPLKRERLKLRAEQEEREAEWYMTHRFGDPGWLKRE